MKHVAGAKNVYAWIVNTPSHAAVRPIEIWGLSPLERLRRSLRAAGVPDDQIHTGAAAAATAQDVQVILLRADYVFDERLIRALIEQKPTRDVVLVDPDNQTVEVFRVPTDNPRTLTTHINLIEHCNYVIKTSPIELFRKF